MRIPAFLTRERPEVPVAGGLPMSAIYGGTPDRGIDRSYAQGSPRSVPSSSAGAVLALANPARRGLSVVHDGTGILYVKHGPGASATDYTKAVGQAETYVIEDGGYRGLVTGAWTVGGSARITEQV